MVDDLPDDLKGGHGRRRVGGAGGGGREEGAARAMRAVVACTRNTSAFHGARRGARARRTLRTGRRARRQARAAPHVSSQPLNNLLIHTSSCCMAAGGGARAARRTVVASARRRCSPLLPPQSRPFFFGMAITLTAPSRADAADALLAAAAAGVAVEFRVGPAFGLATAAGDAVTERNAACKHLASLAADEGVRAALLGGDATSAAVVRDWLARRHSTFSPVTEESMAQVVWMGGGWGEGRRAGCGRRAAHPPTLPPSLAPLPPSSTTTCSPAPTSRAGRSRPWPTWCWRRSFRLPWCV